MLKDKGNILAIIVVILLLFIVIQTYIFPKQTQVTNKYEIKQGEIINKDSLETVIYKRIESKLDSELKIRENKLNEQIKQIKKLQNNYKVIRVSIDSLPYF